MTIRNLESFFRPTAVLVLGAARTPGQLQLFANLAASVPAERRFLAAAEAADWQAVAIDTLSGVRCDLAVLFDGRLLRSELIGRLAAAGVRALIAATDVPVPSESLAHARAAAIRVLGSRSAGAARPVRGVNAAAYARPLKQGRLALIAQSRTVAAAALDWAEGRGIGISWFAVTGAEADVDVADLLDLAAVDPSTRGVVVQLSRISDGRRFMSAARAAARAKPVAILQTRPAGASLGAGQDRVRSAAFARAGLVECQTIAGLFDAVAALDRLAVQGEMQTIVVGNGTGVCALGVDAMLRRELQPAPVAEPLRQELRERWPLARVLPGAVDVGSASAAEVAALTSLLIERGAATHVLLIHGPEPGQPYDLAAEAIAATPHAGKVLTVWLGLASVRAVRDLCAARGVPTFSSPDEAVGALATLRQHRLNQEMLTQTPPLWEGHTPRRGKIAQALAALAAARHDGDIAAATSQMLAEYGIARPGATDPRGLRLWAEFRRHEELGTYLAVRPEARGIHLPETYAFPPLDGLLARRLLEQAGYEWDAPGTGRELRRLALTLIRYANFAIEQPALAAVRLRFGASPGEARCTFTHVTAEPDRQPPPPRRRLALAPYPSGLTHDFELADGQRTQIRAIRPEDEPAMLRMLRKTNPEFIRLRFFTYIREFTHAMAIRLTQIDYDRELGLVATMPAEHPGPGPGEAQEIVGLAHLIADVDGQAAEYAILVAPACAGRGLGKHFMLQLLAHAAAQGIRRVYGEVLAENDAMLGLCRALGFRRHRDVDDASIIHVEIDVAAL